MEFLNKVCQKKRKIVFLLPVLVVFLFLSFPFVIKAGLGEIILGGIFAIPALFMVIALTFLIFISGIWALIAGAILNWVTSPGFISLSYTNPAGPNANPIIAIGLDITKNFVNLALVVILVYIAIAVALRLEGEGAAKKLLTRLVLIALLVNFAPVIVGLIVDAANIVMNYFLDGIKMGIADVLTQTAGYVRVVLSKMLKLSGFAGMTEVVSQGLIMLALNSVTAIVLCLFAALFVFRYIVIWLLVILSPLAFVAWILPATKKYWSMWWSQLIQWSIIGIVAAFFLYLGARSYEALPAFFAFKSEMPGIEPAVTGTLNQALPYFVVAVFLFLGFFIGLSTSAMGAAATMNITKKGGAWVGGKVWKGTRPLAEEKLHLREAAGAVVRGWEGLPILKRTRWFMPEKLRKYGESRPAIDEAQKEASSYSSKEVAHRIAIGADYGTKAVGGMMLLAGRGDMQDFFTAYKRKYYGKKADETSDQELLQNEKFKKETARKLQIALAGGYHNNILRSDPRLARIAIEAKIGDYAKLEDIRDPSTGKITKTAEQQAVGIATSEARGQHIKNWEREVLEDVDVVEAGMERGRDFWESALRDIKRAKETSLESIDLLFTRFNTDVKKHVPKTDKELKDAWQEFREYFKKTHEGKDAFFEYVESDWAKKQGWRRGIHLPPEKVKEIEERRRVRKPPKPEPTTPGAAAGVPPPPEGYPGPGAEPRKKPPKGYPGPGADPRKKPPKGYPGPGTKEGPLPPELL